MATNLRLREETSQAVRREAERTGRSQQDVIRDAIEQQLGLAPSVRSPGQIEFTGPTEVIPVPRIVYSRPGERITLPKGMTSSDLLDRDDRF